MHIRTNEKVLRIYHHHPFPFLVRVFKIVIACVPFYLFIFLIKDALSTKAYVLSAIIIAVLFLSALLYDSILYWQDRLIVTNQRIVYIHWPFFSRKDEFEAEIDDIQDIETNEQGIFSYFKIFDFGMFEIQTAASRVTVCFKDAPDPEGIKHFVFSQVESSDV